MILLWTKDENKGVSPLGLDVHIFRFFFVRQIFEATGNGYCQSQYYCIHGKGKRSFHDSLSFFE
jgi:hypothetical protein